MLDREENCNTYLVKFIVDEHYLAFSVMLDQNLGSNAMPPYSYLAVFALEVFLHLISRIFFCDLSFV